MAEKKYIETEAAIETIKSLYPSAPLVKMNIDKWHEKNKAYMECEMAIEAIPAADVRPVVLCRDCYAYRRDKELAEAAYLDPQMYCGLLRCEMGEDSFCSYGKRKEEL